MTNLSDLYLLVVAAQRLEDRFESRVYQIIKEDSRFAGWSDERKADLYSLIVDTVHTTDRYSTVEDKVLLAWEKNAARFPHG